jgi:enoyl-CoA hydratase/carnithine racemase
MAPTFDNLLYDLDAATGILILTVNRPTKLNALNTTTIAELGHGAARCGRARHPAHRHRRKGICGWG